ncbi:MAG: acetyl-CoA acetyltransferase [marine bacterium B5-7]|nr:MAG: acetyl-CoA acetyltransferase [marine bacterium B5-7]
MTNIVITSATRTPMGGFQGALSTVPSPQLGAAAIQAAVSQANIAPEQIDEVIMGCVLSAGLGQAPARQAALGANLPYATAATTINKMCGSGLEAIRLACDRLQAGTQHIIVAGGMENMSLAPYLLPKARAGYRMGHGQLLDHMFLDGLEDAYDKGCLMGTFAEATATHYAFTREAQDNFALTSLARAQAAIDAGHFTDEITPVTVRTRKGEHQVAIDEQPGNARPEKIPQLKPAFAKDGTVTAANASSISDGAAAVVLMTAEEAKARDCPALAKICGHTSFAQEPAWFTTAPVGAIKTLLKQLNWQIDDVDLFEINEAFAVVSMATMQELKLPADKVNVHGGACALGHPIGASGARIVVTLLHALARTGGKRGIAALCIGGGEAVAIAIERL